MNSMSYVSLNSCWVIYRNMKFYVVPKPNSFECISQLTLKVSLNSRPSHFDMYNLLKALGLKSIKTYIIEMALYMQRASSRDCCWNESAFMCLSCKVLNFCDYKQLRLLTYHHTHILLCYIFNCARV